MCVRVGVSLFMDIVWMCVSGHITVGWLESNITDSVLLLCLLEYRSWWGWLWHRPCRLAPTASSMMSFVQFSVCVSQLVRA